MRGLAAPLLLVAARARRRPGRPALPALGIAVAVAFLAGVATEGTVAGDQGARTALAGSSPLDRSVRVTWQGTPSAGAVRRARGLLSGLGLTARTEVVLLNPVRLSGVVVRPAAIAPLGRWLQGTNLPRLGRCRQASCPMLLAGGGHVPATLTAAGVRIRVAGAAPLSSPVPLAFSPLGGGGPPVLVTSDVAGLEALSGLSGVYRTHSWVASLAVTRLHSWELARLQDRVASVQATLQLSSGQFSLSAPFDGLAAARAEGDAAPRRLLLVGGGAVVALALFVLLAGAGLRRDQLEEVARLRIAGARSDQCLMFLLGESGFVSSVAVLAGAAVGILGGVVVAGSAGEPIGGVLAHSLMTPAAAIALAGVWGLSTALLTASALAREERVIDVLAIVAVVALVVGLAMNPSAGGAPALLLAPLCCLGAGVATFRLAGVLLRAGERLARDGPVRARLAIVGLARSPSLPAAAIAFVAVSVGLGGFSLAYRATLLRGAADQAADRVPLDAIVSPAADFTTPLELAPLSRWRALADGPVFPVRRTEANYASGGGTVTVPALGVSSAGLPSIHGWRESDGSAPLSVLARRLAPPGPARVPGPALTAAASLSVRAAAASAVTVLADLRDPRGDVTQLPLGIAGPRPAFLRARLPAGRWELEALELQQPAGLEATNGHQNAENPAGPLQQQALVELGPARTLGRAGPAIMSASLGSWRAVGGAAPARPTSREASVVVTFDANGPPGVIRPQQPSDTRPVPVLADPVTAAAAGPGGRLRLTVDGLPVIARVAGVLRRFPALPPDAAGFVIADQATLSSALDAQLPGQGRPDELWLTTAHPTALRAALGRSPLVQLGSSFRADLERQLSTAPLSSGVLGTLFAAAAVSAALGIVGLLAALLGPARDRGVERDLEAQGFGPRALRAELRARLSLVSVTGVAIGLVIALLLVRLAVIAVRSAGAVPDPRPGLVTVVPWAELAAWGIGAAAGLVLSGWLASRAAR